MPIFSYINIAAHQIGRTFIVTEKPSIDSSFLKISTHRKTKKLKSLDISTTFAELPLHYYRRFYGLLIANKRSNNPKKENITPQKILY